MPNEDDIKAVSNRNHFISLEAYVEEAVPFYRTHLQKGAALDSILYEFGRRLLHEFRWAVERGATAGIAQAVELVLDPKYRDNKKKRRKDQMERRKKEEEERVTRQLVDSADPEALARHAENQMAWFNRMVDYHRNEMERFEAARRRLLGLGE